METNRRVGATTSKKRDELLDCVERMMAKEGYAAVTYRAVATRAEVTPGLVQYYFPTLDDLFIAAIRRRSDQNFDRLAAALDARPDEPLHVLWEYSQEESTAALTTEFLALGNHRKSIASEIAEVTERVRALQTSAIERTAAQRGTDMLAVPPDVMLFLLTGAPKLIRLEAGVGLTTAHADVVAYLQDFLEAAEPGSTPPRPVS